MDHSDFEDLLDNFTESHFYVISSMDMLMLFDHGNGIMLEPLDQGQYEQLLRALDDVTYIGGETDVQYDHIRKVIDDAGVDFRHLHDFDEDIDAYNTFIVLAAFKLRNGDINYYSVQFYDHDDS